MSVLVFAGLWLALTVAGLLAWYCLHAESRAREELEAWDEEMWRVSEARRRAMEADDER